MPRQSAGATGRRTCAGLEAAHISDDVIQVKIQIQIQILISIHILRVIIQELLLFICILVSVVPERDRRARLLQQPQVQDSGFMPHRLRPFKG